VAPQATVRGGGEVAQGSLVVGGGPDELGDHEVVVGAAFEGDDEACGAGAARRVRELADGVGSGVAEEVGRPLAVWGAGDEEEARGVNDEDDRVADESAAVTVDERGHKELGEARGPPATRTAADAGGRVGSMQALRHNIAHCGPDAVEGGDAIADG